MLPEEEVIPNTRTGQAVQGPLTATDGNVAVFDGSGGDLIKDGGPLGASGITNSAPAGTVPVTTDGNGNLATTPITTDANQMVVTSDYGTVEIGHTTHNHLIHVVAENTVTGIDVTSDDGPGIVVTTNGAFDVPLSALSNNTGDAIEAQSTGGICVWAQSNDSGNTQPTIVAQQKSTATVSLFEAWDAAGSPVFSVNPTGQVTLKPVAFADLPASPLEGMLAWVNNSNTATWGATIAGGGANKVLAVYNGINWTVAGK